MNGPRIQQLAMGTGVYKHTQRYSKGNQENEQHLGQLPRKEEANRGAKLEEK